MVTLEPLPDRTLIVLRNEAKAARAGTMVVRGIDIDMAELLEDAADDIERLQRDVAVNNDIIGLLRAQLRVLGHVPMVVETDDVGRQELAMMRGTVGN